MKTRHSNAASIDRVAQSFAAVDPILRKSLRSPLRSIWVFTSKKPYIIRRPRRRGQTELARAWRTLLTFRESRMQCYEGLDQIPGAVRMK